MQYLFETDDLNLILFCSFRLKASKSFLENRRRAFRSFAPEFTLANSVTRLGNLLDFGQLFKAFGNK